MKTQNIVKIAYKKFKQYVFYEQLDLFQRYKLAEFETNADFDNKLKSIEKIIETLQDNDSIPEDMIKKYIENIGYKILPKSIRSDQINCTDNTSETSGKFITNLRSENGYIIEGINYFIDAPIELHILCVIWAMKAGYLIDANLDDSCYWFRLNDKIKKSDDQSSHLFKYYHQQYSNWRDNAISEAERLLKKENKNITIISMDLKQCYYCINIDFQKLQDYFTESITEEKDQNLAIGLTKIIEAIHQAYWDKIKDSLKYSHHNVVSNKKCGLLPIGLISSGILCNWHLKDLDREIQDKLNPSYYGRYVDDILIVISNPLDLKDSNNQVSSFMSKYFIQNNILTHDKENNGYFFNIDPNLRIQERKLIIHYYSSKYSLALLEKFKQKIIENSSAFYFLPVEDTEYDINEIAYDVQYDGSSNKFRSLNQLSENISELSKNLTKIIATFGQSECKLSALKKIIEPLFMFYKGANFLNYCRTWEKIFTLSIVTKRYNEAALFYIGATRTISAINKISFEKYSNVNCDALNNILKKQKFDLRYYLTISLSMPIGLLGESAGLYFRAFKEECASSDLPEDSFREKITLLSKNFRESNLIRHNYITYPLVNYTNYTGSLINFGAIENGIASLKSENENNLPFEEKKIEYSPRYIHFDEYQLFQILYFIHHNAEKMTDFSIEKYQSISTNPKDYPIRMNYKITENRQDEKEIRVHEYLISEQNTTAYNSQRIIKIGLANIVIDDSNIRASYMPLRKPNISFQRQKEIYNLLNLAKREKCELLILPELSIPYFWLPFMIRYARYHQMGIIFGMEYWIVKDMAYNFIVAALPVRDNDKYKSCCVSLRCKNHYSPKEKRELERAGLKTPDLSTYQYDLLKWKESQFSLYNCYELADIKHRALFRSDLDFLVACVLNRDINYFSNIIESVVKDLHCYVVQVNSSRYGDSRVVQPTKNEKMNILRVSGGENSTILTASLDISKLRDFQSLGYSETDTTFKPAPPGHNIKRVIDRCNHTANNADCRK